MRWFVGPCSIESQDHLESILQMMERQNITWLRGGISKYRSVPGDYQGNKDAIRWIKEAKRKYDFKYVVEVFNERDLHEYRQIADMWQVGSRNMYNTDLLKKINDLNKIVTRKNPVLFKRHFSSSLTSFLSHANYLKDCDVTLCLRGIMSLWMDEQRFMPDVTDILRLRKLTTLPIAYDVSHPACHVDYVPKLIKAAELYEADAVMVEVHPMPRQALSDPDQQLNIPEFEKIYAKNV